MALVKTFLKGIRNHWKKSIFTAVALTYGINYANGYIKTQTLMKTYCNKAAVYGRQPILNDNLPRKVTVILNPCANKRKAVKNFEKYCLPILNLAGICVEIIQTESEGHAKTLIETLNPTDAIVVAGGDGTLSEVITGLLRHADEDKNFILPIGLYVFSLFLVTIYFKMPLLGVLPLGKNNCFCKSLFSENDYIEQVHSLANASLAIVEQVLKPVDVMRIEVVEDENASKPIYAVSCIEWGAYRDAQVKKDSYWYFGSLRKYVTYIFNGYKNNLNWNCKAIIKYSAPCEGCSNCYVESKSRINRRWYHSFLSHKSTVPLIVNNKCKETYETSINTSDLMLLTSNVLSHTSENPPKLTLHVGPNVVDYIEFIRQGWRTEHGQRRKILNTIEARQIEIRPFVTSNQNKELQFSIDKEDFEVKSVQVTLMPKLIQVYYKKSDTIVAV